MCIRDRPELTATAYFEFTNEETDFSKAWTYFPPWLDAEVNAPFLRIEVTTEISSLPTKGMLMGIFNN